MSRCYACCQENCDYKDGCVCSCHTMPSPPSIAELMTAVVDAARGVRHKTKALRKALAALDERKKP